MSDTSLAGSGAAVVSRENEANLLVRNYMIGAMTAGLIPAPGIDFLAITAVQLKMLHGLSRVYEVPFSQDMGKSALAAVAGCVGNSAIAGGIFGSLAKLIPGIGTAAGVIAVPVAAGATTYALGRVFVQHFESGGTFLTFNPNLVKEHYMKEFKAGQKLATELKPEAEKAAKA